MNSQKLKPSLSIAPALPSRKPSLRPVTKLANIRCWSRRGRWLREGSSEMKFKKKILIQIGSLVTIIVCQIEIGMLLRIVEYVVRDCVFFVCAVVVVYFIRVMNRREPVQCGRHEVVIAYFACHLKGLYCIPEGMRCLARRW